MALLENGQTCLEKRGIEERENELPRSHYNENEPYGPTHPDALSDGDPQGKGTGHGGHTAWQPDCTLPNQAIKYDNFDTFNGGGQYDIEGRNDIGGRERAISSSMYNYERPYGAGLVNTSENIAKGQYYVGMTTKNM